jgi:hypothetical protein
MLSRTMMPQRCTTGARPAEPSVNLWDGGQVQSALNLYLPLKTPAQFPALAAEIKAAQPTVYEALASLHYVHFARFLGSPDYSALWVITTFDGEIEPYIMDFVGVLGDVFTALLLYVRDAPPLPVQRFAREFVEFVIANNVSTEVWSAYPSRTVIDVLDTLGGP